ncbi:hypothetical protein [Micromonospora sp. NPDC005806]|uniref:hypothetical protein n=1 Tax=Micromonospora sp. NPDC005806 TaxID=3364234 RepID=UPI0036825A70
MRAGDEGREGRIGAFDEADEAAVADPRRPGGHVDEDGERCWQVVHCTIRQEGDELPERPSGFGCGEQRVGAYGPDPVAGVFGVGVEDEPVGGGGVADGDDVQGWQDLQGPLRLRGAGGWLVVASQPECVGAERVESDGAQAVVAAEVVEVVGAPVAVVVGAGADRVGVLDVDEAEGRGVLEQHGEGVPALEDRPVRESAVAEAAVLRVYEYSFHSPRSLRATVGEVSRRRVGP